METSQKQTSQSTGGQLTFLQEDSRANRTVQQDSDLVRQTLAISGRKCLEQYEKFNRATSWGKMFAASLIGTGDWYSTKCRLTWKLRATKSSRFYFQLAVSTLPTGGIEFGLWPTPTSVQRNHPERVIGLLEKGATTMMSRKNGENRPNSILDAAMFYKLSLLPTPNASDNRNRGNPSHPCIQKRIKNGKQVGLTMMVDGQLNPRFVAEMMGFPPDWCDLPSKPEGMRLSRKSRIKSIKQSN